MKKITSIIVAAKEKVHGKYVGAVAAAHAGLIYGQNALAQEDAPFKMPTVDVPGLDGTGDPAETGLTMFKWFALILVYLLTMSIGVVVLMNIIKAVKKVSRDSDLRWNDVVGEIFGNVAVLIAFVVFAGWLTAFLV